MRFGMGAGTTSTDYHHPDFVLDARFDQPVALVLRFDEEPVASVLGRDDEEPVTPVLRFLASGRMSSLAREAA